MLLLKQMPLQSWPQPHQLLVAGETLPAGTMELKLGGDFICPRCSWCLRCHVPESRPVPRARLLSPGPSAVLSAVRSGFQLFQY